jgi:hypothetical protein
MHTAARLLNIALSARDKMDMGMENYLTSIRASVYADIEARD